MEHVVEISPKSVWRHKNGNLYTIMFLTNVDSERQEEHPMTVVYSGPNGKLWSRPVSRWLSSFTRVRS